MFFKFLNSVRTYSYFNANSSIINGDFNNNNDNNNNENSNNNNNNNNDDDNNDNKQLVHVKYRSIEL